MSTRIFSALLSCALVPASALGQGILASPAPAYFGPVPPVGSDASSTALESAPGFLHQAWGDLHPSLAYSLSYGTGISSSPSNHVSTTIQSLSEGLLLDLGSHWVLDYTATERVFSDSSLAGGTEQSIALRGQTHYQDWGFNLSQTYLDSTVPDTELGGQSTHETYSTALAVNRSLGSKLIVDMGLTQSIQDESQFVRSMSSWNRSVSAGFAYAFWPRFALGLSGALGDNQSNPGGNSLFEQIGGTVRWQVGNKLSLTAAAGLENYEIQGHPLLSPIFSTSLGYKLFDPTTLSLTAGRTVSPSFFQDQVIVSTAVSAALSQRLFKKLTLTVSGTYAYSPFYGIEHQFEYNTITPAGTEASQTVQITREDTTRSLSFNLGFPFMKKAAVSVFYSLSSNTSGVAGFSYSTQQAGLNLSYRF